MFKALASKFSDVFSSLTNKVITEEDLEKAVKEIRIALIEADVALESVKSFTSSLKEKFIGEDVIKKTNPVQMVIKLTQDEITDILASNHEGLKQTSECLFIMMVGLQGAGKTTTAGKLALMLKSQNKKVLLASLDVRRPSAQQQLELLAKRTGVESLPIIANEIPLEITKRAMLQASKFDVIILDTAGRSELEEELMQELQEIKNLSKPQEILLVMDALYGRQSLNLAKAFDEKLSLTGTILTRMESETRGGIAFNIKHSLKKPIKFYGTGEKMEDFEEFHPERIANRILDMGDVVSLVEKAKNVIDEKEAEKLKQKMEKGKFDFEDFLKQIQGLKKMGGLSKIASFIPGASKFTDMLESGNKQEEIYKQEAIILSMTSKERRNPALIINSGSRKSRIAKGSGMRLIEVNKFIKQFEGMKKMMESFGKIDKSALEKTKNVEDLMKMFKK
jgi:signal recognition particle subunit SRP54